MIRNLCILILKCDACVKKKCYYETMNNAANFLVFFSTEKQRIFIENIHTMLHRDLIIKVSAWKHIS